MTTETSMLLTVTLVAAVGGSVLAFVRARMRVRKKLRFVDREVLNPDDLTKAYPAAYNPQTIKRALAEVSSATGVSIGLLRPTDRFAVELASPRGLAWEFDDGLAELVLSLQRRSTATGKAPDIHSIKTVEDYVRTVAELEQGGWPTPHRGDDCR